MYVTTANERARRFALLLAESRTGTRESPCVEWPSEWATHEFGYGIIRRERRNWPVHRWNWIQINGPTDLFVLHDCDNPPCFRIAHLHLGTQAMNITEMYERGRHTNQFTGVTNCVNGHPFDESNTYYRPDGRGRQCIACQRINEGKK